MMTIKEALDIWLHTGTATYQQVGDAEEVVVAFAYEMLRMLDGLACVSFPIPGHLRITLDPDDDTDAVFITTATADRIYRALGAALAVQS